MLIKKRICFHLKKKKDEQPIIVHKPYNPYEHGAPKFNPRLPKFLTIGSLPKWRINMCDRNWSPPSAATSSPEGLFCSGGSPRRPAPENRRKMPIDSTKAACTRCYGQGEKSAWKCRMFCTCWEERASSSAIPIFLPVLRPSESMVASNTPSRLAHFIAKPLIWRITNVRVCIFFDFLFFSLLVDFFVFWNLKVESF